MAAAGVWKIVCGVWDMRCDTARMIYESWSLLGSKNKANSEVASFFLGFSLSNPARPEANYDLSPARKKKKERKDGSLLSHFSH
jgi:hypothetical protein